MASSIKRIVAKVNKPAKRDPKDLIDVSYTCGVNRAFKEGIPCQISFDPLSECVIFRMKTFAVDVVDHTMHFELFKLS